MNATRGRKTRPGWATWLRAVTLVLLLAVLVTQGRTQAMPSGANGAPGGPSAAKGGKADAAAGDEELIATSNVFRIMREGGVLMYPIAFCSLVLLAFVFERLISLRRGRVIPKPFVTRVLQQVREGELDRAQALALCEENESPVAAVFAGAVRKWGRPAVEVEQAIIDAGERATNGLRRYLRVFSAVSTIAPLLGLLGTVFGMIQAFNAVAVSDALGRPELLAKGVSQALLTTAFGLVVAIPALLVYYVFVSRVDHLITDIDALGQELVHLISAEEMQGRSEEARVAKSRRPRRDAAA